MNTSDEILALPPADLGSEARSIRDRFHGSRISYSPKVFIPLTSLCRDKCGYCTFAQPPARLESAFLSPDDVLAIARDGAADRYRSSGLSPKVNRAS